MEDADHGQYSDAESANNKSQPQCNVLELLATKLDGEWLEAWRLKSCCAGLSRGHNYEITPTSIDVSKLIFDSTFAFVALFTLEIRDDAFRSHAFATLSSRLIWYLAST